jgi:hypothetical protein
VSVEGELPIGRSAPAPALPPRCLNCDAELRGDYCSACGQRAQDPDPTLRELLSEAWDAFVSVDGKLLSSLKLLLTRPGELTVEHLRGRRARYMPPLKLYLICSLAYFLISSLTPATGPAVVRISLDDPRSATGTSGADTSRRRAPSARRDSAARAILARHGVSVMGALDSTTRAAADSLELLEEARKIPVPRWVQQRLARGAQHVIRDNKNFSNDIAAQVPRMMFVMMPVFALLLALAYRSRRRRYPLHLIVSLHLHAFFFAVLALDALGVTVPWSLAKVVLKPVAVLWILAYVPTALRRVYGGRWRYAVLRTVLLCAEYSIVGALGFAVLALGLVLAY